MLVISTTPWSTVVWYWSSGTVARSLFRRRLRTAKRFWGSNSLLTKKCLKVLRSRKVKVGSRSWIYLAPLSSSVKRALQIVSTPCSDAFKSLSSHPIRRPPIPSTHSSRKNPSKPKTTHPTPLHQTLTNFSLFAVFTSWRFSAQVLLRCTVPVYPTKLR